jgi:hypothetical protein
MGEAEMGHVGGASQVLVFEDEQHVPVQALPHVVHETGGDIGVGVNPRPRREAFGVRSELATCEPDLAHDLGLVIQLHRLIKARDLTQVKAGAAATITVVSIVNEFS